MNDTSLSTRRHFLKTFTAGSLASALTAKGQSVDTPISSKLSQHIDDSWHDQYDKPFKMTSLSGKPYVLIFGYNGCQYCNMISQNLAKLRAVDDSKVQDVPIVVVNVTPETDRKDRRDYVAGYYANGVCQSPEEATAIKAAPDAQKMDTATAAYDKDEAIAQADRKFHLVFPPSNAAAQALESSMDITRDPTDDQSHGLYMALVDGSGKCVASKFAATSDPAKCKALVDKMTSAISAFEPGARVKQ